MFLPQINCTPMLFITPCQVLDDNPLIFQAWCDLQSFTLMTAVLIVLGQCWTDIMLLAMFGVKSATTELPNNQYSTGWFVNTIPLNIAERCDAFAVRNTSVFSQNLESEMLCFGSCLFKTPQSPLIGQPTQAWPSVPNNNISSVLNHFLHAKLATIIKLWKWMTWWCSVMSQSHRIKGGTTDEVFQSSCFLWERGASVGVDFENVYILWYGSLYKFYGGGYLFIYLLYFILLPYTTKCTNNIYTRYITV